jgi:DNA-binding Xre family transcriptional regulator
MKYRTKETEEIMHMIAEEKAVNHAMNAELSADYLNGAIVQQILEIMHSKHMSQQDLAQRIGKSKQYVSKILREKRNFTIASLAAIAQALESKVVIELKQDESTPIETSKNKTAAI